MFTKISKVILWIGIIGCLILSIILGVSTKSFLTFLSVFLGTIVVFSVLGVLIEISENIAESKDFLSNIDRKLGSCSTGVTNSSSFSETSPNYMGVANKLSAIANGEMTHSEDFWFCRGCGTKNDKLSPTCKGCGKYK